ncbi:MAG: CoB--CoM heterodisulfide reductase iron-sulfur subunit A family protein [Deltaproteobacteria bacterium]|nr:CoB--CoM heterodisulfide reductase iron-sulfur subunit A family protein [Deltaproteobacteria bacterium]
MGASDAAPRIGIYVCHCGGNISDVVDCAAVVQAAADFPHVAVAREHSFMCSDAAQTVIIDDIRNLGLNRVVVASCSPSLHATTFRSTCERGGLNPYLYEHANIREQVSWVHGGQHASATAKAVRLVRAAAAKVALLTAERPIEAPVRRHALVVGGGVAGLCAAGNLAEAGVDVTLVERSPFLGGHATELGKLARIHVTGREVTAALAHVVLADPHVRVLTNAEVVRIGGHLGDFEATVRVRPRGIRGPVEPDRLRAAIDACPEEVVGKVGHGTRTHKALYLLYDGCLPAVAAIDFDRCTRCGRCVEILGRDAVDLDEPAREETVQVGGVVVATGFEQYEPYVDEFGWGKPGVVTLPQLIQILHETGDAKTLTIAGRTVRNLVMIHCVGSRQIDGVHQIPEGRTLNPQCSRMCCTAAIYNSTELRARFADLRVYQLVRDVRTYGRHHEQCYQRASEQRLLFFKYPDHEPPVVSDGLPSDDAPLAVTVQDQFTRGQTVRLPADAVVLVTGMAPGGAATLIEQLKLAVGADGFLREVHPKLRPVELAVQGVMVAGTAQSPMAIEESTAAAAAAAVKAAKLLTRETLSLDPQVARVDPARCEGTGRCVEQCAYGGALQVVERTESGRTVRRAEVNEALCKGCGACVAVCPHNAIDVVGSTLAQLYASVDALTAQEVA